MAIKGMVHRQKNKRLSEKIFSGKHLEEQIMKIALTGSGGFLGSRIMEYYKDRLEIIPLRHQETALLEQKAVDSFFLRKKPEVLIHCAAVSDTGECEKSPEKSCKVNVEIPAVLAKACRKYGAKMIFCSSDQVYFEETLEFQKEYSHTEEEALHPKGVYGQQKLQAEKRIQEICPDAVILRLSWMYDWKRRESEHGTLVSTIRENVEKGRTVSYPVYDYRSITNVWEIVENLHSVFALPGGVYNFGSRNEYSTFEVVQRILKLMGKDESLLLENRESFKECPRNIRMDTGKLERHGICFRTTEDGLRFHADEKISREAP